MTDMSVPSLNLSVPTLVAMADIYDSDLTSAKSRSVPWAAQCTQEDFYICSSSNIAYAWALRKYTGDQLHVTNKVHENKRHLPYIAVLFWMNHFRLLTGEETKQMETAWRLIPVMLKETSRPRTHFYLKHYITGKVSATLRKLLMGLFQIMPPNLNVIYSLCLPHLEHLVHLSHLL